MKRVGEGLLPTTHSETRRECDPQRLCTADMMSRCVGRLARPLLLVFSGHAIEGQRWTYSLFIEIMLPQPQYFSPILHRYVSELHFSHAIFQTLQLEVVNLRISIC